MGFYRTEETIIQNLKDAGCGQAAIQSFLDDLRGGEPSKGIRLLEKHRRTLLDNLHQEQKRIDCLDYLLFMLSGKPFPARILFLSCPVKSKSWRRACRSFRRSIGIRKHIGPATPALFYGKPITTGIDG